MSDYSGVDKKLGEKPTNVVQDLNIAKSFIDRHMKKHPNDLPE